MRHKRLMRNKVLLLGLVLLLAWTGVPSASMSAGTSGSEPLIVDDEDLVLGTSNEEEKSFQSSTPESIDGAEVVEAADEDEGEPSGNKEGSGSEVAEEDTSTAEHSTGPVEETEQKASTADESNEQEVATDDGGSVFSAGDGSEANPYIITTAEELDAVRGELAAHYQLGHDIDLTAFLSEKDGEGWEPIGGSAINPFTGTFDGQGYTITGLRIKRDNDNGGFTYGIWQGLFGFIGQNGSVKDVTLLDVDIRANGNAGALAGQNDGTISNSHAAGDVHADSRVGGLVGYNTGGIYDSAVTGTVSGDHTVGGLVGYSSEDGAIYQSSSSAAVHGDGHTVGGLVGTNIGEISTSYATGTVSGKKEVGGLAGHNSGKISDAYVTGAVQGGSDGTDVGGLVGVNYNEIRDSHAAGSVSGNEYVGGLVGYNAKLNDEVDGEINTSYATGDVSGTSFVGGLVGQNEIGGKISDSYATGAVRGDNNIGGFVGVHYGEISSSYAIGTASGNGYVGGLVGFQGAGDIHHSFWNTSVYGDSDPPHNDLGESKTEEDLKQRHTYEDWDFTNMWFLYEDQTMPFLQWQNPFESLEVDMDKEQLSVDDTVQINVLARHQQGEYGAEQEAKYSVTHGENVVDVDAQGLVTATAAGEATIAVSLYDQTKTVNITVDSGPIIYVNKEGTGNGSSWDDAIGDLQQAIDAATSGQQIWIAAGTYTSTKQFDGNDPRTAAFQMKNGVEIYGGFAGTEDPDFNLDDRDWEQHETILSGDLRGNDDGTDESKEDNAYHVFYHPEGTKLDETAVLDGVTITGGHANGTSYGQNKGGGMYNEGRGFSGYFFDGSSPTLKNVIITGNHADDSGGGISNMYDSHPTLDNVMIGSNSSNKHGGGMYSIGSSNPKLSSVTISDNQAGEDGGGLYNSSSNFNLTDVTIENNSARDGGGLYVSQYYPVLTDVTIKGNSATRNGGGLYSTFNSRPELSEVLILENAAGNGGGGMYISSGSPQLENVILSHNEAGHSGGGLYYNDTINSKIQSSTINGNTAQFGGGLFIASGTPSLLAVTISGNEAQSGGGLYNRGGRPTLASALISGNKAVDIGGGIVLFRMARMINVTISGNEANGDGSGIYNSSSGADIHNSIIWGNGDDNIFNMGELQPTYSLIERLDALGIEGEGNIDADPNFVNPVPSGEAPTTGGDYQLNIGSPAINQGNNSQLDVVPVDIDLNGETRIFDGTVDMGAYELSLELASIETLGDIDVPNGTPENEIGLPNAVEATLSNGDKHKVQVNWGTSDPTYDGKVPGTYVFTGEPERIPGVAIPDGMQVHVNVIVGDPFVTEVPELDEIEVDIGTDQSQLELPEQVKVVLNNEDQVEVNVTWDNGEPVYDADAVGTYMFTGTLSLDEDGYVTNPDGLKASISVRVVNPITDVSELQSDVVIGTEQSELGLPEQVEVVLKNGGRTNIDVIWDNGDPEYDADAVGTYLFTGTLALDEDGYVTNPDELEANIRVRVVNPITKVPDLPEIQVNIGTERMELELPEEVNVTLSNSEALAVSVIWDNGQPVYDGNAVGTYTFTGTLSLDENGYVTNPDVLKASIRVQVVNPIIEVYPLDDIEVANGTEQAVVGLPEQVEVTLSNGDTVLTDVRWDNGTPEYNGKQAGTYTFTGTLGLPDGVTNPEGFTASVNVIVGAPFIIEIVGLDDKEVVHETGRDALDLPTQIEVTLSNGSTLTLTVSWDGGTPPYNGTIAGIYTFTGTLMDLPDGITIPDDFMVTIKVTVLEKGDPGDGGGPGGGDPDNGDPGNGGPGNGDPGNGDPGEGDPGDGRTPSRESGSGDTDGRQSGELPKTATPYYTALLVGALLLLVGGILFIWKRRRELR